MKLSNIFKKTTAKNSKYKIQKMDKKQLAKVIGGTDEKTRSTGSEVWNQPTDI